MPVPINPPIKRSLVQLNGNQMCAVDVETTGTRPGYHEIIQIAIMPVDAKIQPYKLFPILDLTIRPEYPERADPEAVHKVGKERFANAMVQGIPSEKARDIFEDWFAKLKLPEEKKITPLGANYQFDKGMIIDWLGFEGYNFYFDWHYRDVFITALFLNDRADFSAEQLPFSKNQQLGALAKQLGIEIDGELHDAIYDCLICSKVYRQMLIEHII